MPADSPPGWKYLRLRCRRNTFVTNHAGRAAEAADMGSDTGDPTAVERAVAERTDAVVTAIWRSGGGDRSVEGAADDADATAA